MEPTNTIEKILASAFLYHIDPPVMGAFERFVHKEASLTPTKAIINDPATVVFMGKKKYVTKAKGGDEYDPMFGLMACCLRGVGNNHVSVDEWENVIAFLADEIGDAKECRLIADMLNATANAIELDGVEDAMEEYDKRRQEEAIHAASASSRAYIVIERNERADSSIRNQERTRQTVRNLIDRGEL